MNIKQIESLARIMSKNGLTTLEVSEGELKISIKKEVSQVVVQSPTPKATVTEISQSMKNDIILEDNKTEKNGFSFNGLKEITSPIAGVFYASPSPDSPAFVKVGDKVKKGDVLCIIEAMKLMNELTADKDGEIADVCVTNEQIVEYGQTLFTLY
ncbi:MAG: acetyl-CoA carboxylase, biotin carboxyl carrier protein [Clostridiales bacterium GWF2_36_10]|nr:MAG: acetyl-CoA carboxylase, biotin carboxyl carrier protein [Clostridiales bacterium GWF2_36_10]HAN21075.1 acetyl-CoA carboxylase biotin carboxyl carrier protein [Clostridiales bacterium]